MEIGNATLLILDIRSRDDFVQEHIPGSVWVDAEGWRNKTFEQTGLTDKDYWQEALRNAGIKSNSRIVVAGESLPEISRMWWLLKYFGANHVQVIDGGYAAWKKAELPTESGEPKLGETGDIEVAFKPEMIAVVDDLMPEALTEGKVRILDNRSTAEFTGARGVGTRTGHVPGSVHLEWTKLLDEDRKFLPVEEISKLLQEHGVSADEPIVTLCQTGGRSCVAALALEIVGAKQVKNFYRGWGEYAGRLTAPVEKGD